MTGARATASAAAEMPVICLASSLLQKVVFLASRHAMRPHLLVGNRGLAGDVTYQRSVLNDPRFFADLDDLVARRGAPGGGPVELFLPNALNSVFYYALTHPRIARISFTDEGMLTNRFLDGGYRKPTARGVRAFPAAFALARRLPGRARLFAYRVIAWLVKRTVGMRYERNTRSYPLRTIELSRKGGVVLSHIAPVSPLPWVEHVDLTRDIRVPRDYEGAACLFIHPREVARPEQVDALCARIALAAGDFARGLVKPHPLFSEFPDRLEALITRLSTPGTQWFSVEVSGRYEPTIELYARGVRTFIVGKSSVRVTVASHPAYFSDLALVEI